MSLRFINVGTEGVCRVHGRDVSQCCGRGRGVA